MSKPFDAVTRRLLEADPLAWLGAAGLSGTTADLIDADLSTVTSEADRILRVRRRNLRDYLAHFEMQSSFDIEMILRLLRYNVLIFCKYGIPVVSILFLLRKKAERARYSGFFSYDAPEDGWEDGPTLTFRYRVVRVWELNVEDILKDPLALLPLSPLTNVSKSELPRIVRQMEARIEAEATLADQGDLWISAYILMGLKYKSEFS